MKKGMERMGWGVGGLEGENKIAPVVTKTQQTTATLSLTTMEAKP